MLHFGHGLPMQQLHDCRERCVPQVKSDYFSRGPGLSEKYFSNLSFSSLKLSASAGASPLRVMFGQSVDRLRLSSSHFSRPFSVSGRMALGGHSGSQTPQSMHSS